MKNYKYCFFSVVFTLLVININAQIKVGPLFSNDMILQRNSEVPIWGEADANQEISIQSSWNQKKTTTKADSDGNWSVKIETPEAGGPYNIDIISSNSNVKLSNVLIGEVWITSGQSNMQMTLNGYTHEPVLGSLDMIANANNTNIRLFTFKRVTSNKPIRDVKGKWLVSNSENTAVFSAIGYSFANYLNKVLDIPIGIINTSWGGTPAEAWTDNKTLVENFKKSEIKNFREGKPKNHDPSALFNGMINPLIPFKIRGALWYQGESNVSRANNYTKLMNVMIDGWRREWNQGSFPFYFVQIAPFKYSGSNKSESAYLREAQLKTMLQTKNSGMAVTLDIGKEFSIHPDKKIIIGKRLAYWALANDYKVKGVPFSGPVYKSIEINEDKAIVDFDYAESGFIFLNSKINGFEIAGEDKVFHPASVKVMYGNKNSTLTISSDKVKEPVAVRYGWKNYLKGNLYNTKGLPASSFRSDNW
mgnify:FL=1